MHSWVDDLDALSANALRSIMVTVVSVRGSAPREIGARMLVTETATTGTIGGGQLEYQSAQIAYRKLRDDVRQSERRRFALGANCGQCCGGIVEVLFEPVQPADSRWIRRLAGSHRGREPVAVLTALDQTPGKVLVFATATEAFAGAAVPDAALVDKARSLLKSAAPTCVVDGFLIETVCESNFNIAVFGAGHVGAATVDVLSRLDCNLRWVDSRRAVLPSSAPRNIVPVEAADPALEVGAMPAGAYYLIMTHSHQLDQQICERILARRDFAYCGLIGSAAKRRRFEKRMLKNGLTRQDMHRLTCPIGIPGIAGRRPVEIAIAVAAELIEHYEKQASTGMTPVLREVGN